MNYEESINQQRRQNREILKDLGILRADYDVNGHKLVKKTNYKETSSLKTNVRKSGSPYMQPTRRSARIKNIEPPKYDPDFLSKLDENEDFQQSISKKVKRENTFGAIPGVDVGTHFDTRLEASAAGIHRPTVAGIHGNPSLGCYSLALSGGYEDDVDLGESFIYTGEGGRDLKGTKANPKNLRTAPQSKDQVLERGNLALSMNVKNNLPVRVIRGYKLKSDYAPTEGYRYDGIYNVVEYYTTTGLSGFQVYKFRLVRAEHQDPAPWSKDFLGLKKEE